MSGTAVFDHTAARARDARVATFFTSAVRWSLIATVVALLLLGAYLVITLRSSSGWFFASLASLPAVLYIWWAMYLRDIPVGKNTTIDAQLEGEFLGLLPAKPTPKDIGAALMKCRGISRLRRMVI